MSPTRILPFAAAAFFPALVPLHAAPQDIGPLLAQLQLATGDDDTLARIELLRRILDAAPGDSASHALLIRLWIDIGDYDMAGATLAAWPDAPADLAAITRAKIQRFRNKDAAGAVRTLNEYLASAPGNIEAWKLLVDTLIASDDQAAALEALDALIKLEKTATALIQRANVKVALGDYPGAIADAEAAQALDADADIVKNSLPRFERLKETDAALPALDAAITKDPRDFAALVERAWWFLYGGVQKRTAADAGAALAVRPGSLAARILKFDALYGLGEIESWKARAEENVDVLKSIHLSTAQAIAACDTALAKNPGDAAQLRARAFALNEAEQYLLAQADAESALDLDPKNAKAALEGIFATAMLGGDSAPLFRRLEAMKPAKSQLALANGYLAEMYFRQSNFALTLEFANRSLAAQETERFLRVKASVLQRLDRGAEAAAALKRADALKKKSR